MQGKYRYSVDPVILPELKYDEPLTRAVAEMNSFKFTGTSSMQFFCSTELCRKSHDECIGISVWFYCNPNIVKLYVL